MPSRLLLRKPPPRPQSAPRLSSCPAVAWGQGPSPPRVWQSLTVPWRHPPSGSPACQGTAHSLIQLVNLLLVVAQPWRRQTGPRSPMRSVSRAEWCEDQASCEADGGSLGPAQRSQPRGARR